MKVSNVLIFSCVVLAFFIGNLWSINITQSVKISVLDIVVAIGLVGQIRQIGQIGRMRQIIKPATLFVLAACVSLLFSLRLFPAWQVGIGSLYLLRWVAYMLFFASNVYLLKLDQISSIIHGLGISLLVTGLTQYVFFPDIRPLAYLQWDMHFYRLVGTFLDPGFTSLLLVLYFLFVLTNPVKNKGLQWILIVTSYVCIALTYSRSGYLALLAGSAYLAWKIRGWKFFAGILLLLTITVAILPRASDGEGVKLERANSIWSRLDSWKTAVTIFARSPELGVGFNNYRYAQNKYGFLTDPKWQVSHAGAGADSSLLFVAATTGIIGLTIYLWYLKTLYDFQSLNLTVALAAIVAHSFFLNSLFYPAVLAWLGLLTAQAVMAVNAASTRSVLIGSKSH